MTMRGRGRVDAFGHAAFGGADTTTRTPRSEDRRAGRSRFVAGRSRDGPVSPEGQGAAERSDLGGWRKAIRRERALP